MTNLKIIVQGRVQGVGFRAAVEQKARQLGVFGWVANQADGSVLIEAEGPEATLNQLIDWSKRGPKLAQVTEVQIIPGMVQGFTDFQIKR